MFVVQGPERTGRMGSSWQGEQRGVTHLPTRGCHGYDVRSRCLGLACASGDDGGRGGWLASISPLLAPPPPWALAGGLISGDSSAGKTMRAAAPPARALCQLQPCARCDEAAGDGSGPSAASRHAGVWCGLGRGGLQRGTAGGGGMQGRNEGHPRIGAGKEPGDRILDCPPAWQLPPLQRGWPVRVERGVPGADPPALCCSMWAPTHLPGTPVAEGAVWCSPPAQCWGRGETPYPAPQVVGVWQGGGQGLAAVLGTLHPAVDGWGRGHPLWGHCGEARAVGQGKRLSPVCGAAPHTLWGLRWRVPWGRQRRGAGRRAGCPGAGSPRASRDSSPALARFPQRGHGRAWWGVGPHRCCPTVPPAPHSPWHTWAAPLGC